MILSIEDLMYQLGGQLPSIVQDSISSAQLAQMQGQVTPFTQRAQELGPSDFYTYLDKQRALDNQRNNQKTTEATTKKAEISNSLKTLSSIQDRLDKESKSVTGLPLYFKEAQKIDGEIKKEMALLQDDIANAQIALSTGKEVSPETFDKIIERKGKIQNIMSSPQYGKLAAFSPIIKEQIKKINEYNSDPDYIVDSEKYNEWILGINNAVASGEDVDLNVAQFPKGLVADKRVIDKAVTNMVDNYIKDNTSLSTSLSPTDYHKVIGKSKVKTVDLTKLDDATEFMIGYIKTLPGGETYLKDYAGGDDGFKSFINNRLKASGKNPGGVTQQTIDSGVFNRQDTMEESAQKTAINAQTKNANRKLTAAEVSVEQMQDFLAEMGVRSIRPDQAIKNNSIGSFDSNTLMEFIPKINRGGVHSNTVNDAITNYGLIDIETGKEIEAKDFIDRVQKRYSGDAGTVQPRTSNRGVNQISRNNTVDESLKDKERKERTAKIKESLKNK